MAQLFIGLNRGQYPQALRFQSTTLSTDVELRIDLSKGLTDIDRSEMVEIIKQALMNPPQPGVNGFQGFGDNNT